MRIEPGRTVQHHRIVEKIGEGGMGAVGKAVDANLDRAPPRKAIERSGATPRVCPSEPPGYDERRRRIVVPARRAGGVSDREDDECSSTARCDGVWR